MTKIGYVSGCLGMHITAELLGIDYKTLAKMFFREEMLSSYEQHRLQLAALILTRGGCTAIGPNVSTWFTTSMSILGGKTPATFISTWSPGHDISTARALVSNPPKPKINHALAA